MSLILLHLFLNFVAAVPTYLKYFSVQLLFHLVVLYTTFTIEVKYSNAFLLFFYRECYLCLYDFDLAAGCDQHSCPALPQHIFPSIDCLLDKSINKVSTV